MLPYQGTCGGQPHSTQPLLSPLLPGPQGGCLTQPRQDGPCSQLPPPRTLPPGWLPPLPRQAIQERPGTEDRHPTPGTSRARNSRSHRQAPPTGSWSG